MSAPSGWKFGTSDDASRYRHLSTRIYLDARVRRFDIVGKAVWQYLLCNHHTTLLPGVYPLHETTAAADLGLTVEGFREGFRQPSSHWTDADGVTHPPMVEADWDAGLVWVRNAWRYEPPQNPNQLANWRKLLLNELPECALLQRAIRGIISGLLQASHNPESFAEAVEKHIPEPFRKPFREPLPEGFGQPLPKPGIRNQESGSSSSSSAREDAKVGGREVLDSQPPAQTPANGPGATSSPLPVQSPSPAEKTPPAPAQPHLRAVPGTLTPKHRVVAGIKRLREEAGLQPEARQRYEAGDTVEAGVADFGEDGFLRAYSHFLKTQTAVVKGEGEVELAKREPPWPWALFAGQVDTYLAGPRERAPPRRAGGGKPVGSMGIAKKHAPEGVVS